MNVTSYCVSILDVLPPKYKDNDITSRDTIKAHPIGVSVNGSDVELDLIAGKLTGKCLGSTDLSVCQWVRRRAGPNSWQVNW